MANLRETNDNILRNAEYSVRFFRYDYVMNEGNISMMDNDRWLVYLGQVNSFSVPLVGINSFEGTQQIWYRNKNASDSITIEIDSSYDHNIVEFIAKEVQYINVDLQDLNKMAAILYVDYIDNLGNQQIKTMYIGRPSVSNYKVGSGAQLSIKIEQFNRILDGSDFEKNVVEYPTGANYSYISLLQAFGNIYNLPHNREDDYAYPGTPFRLNQETYVPKSDVDIVLRDGQLPPDVQLYAEDTVANDTGYTHSQFFYMLNNPQCGVKITKYDSDGEIIDTPITTYTADWNVWGNTLNAVAGNWGSGGVATSYARFFRPFKVVYAPSEEVDIIREYRDLELNYPGFTFPDSFYSLVRNTDKEGISNYNPDLNDILIYFEALGDVTPPGPSHPLWECCLFTNNSNVFVYNLSKDIVYFDYLAINVKSTPMPKQWLDIGNYFPSYPVRFTDHYHYSWIDENIITPQPYTYFFLSMYNRAGSVSSGFHPTPMLPIFYGIVGFRSYQKSWDDFSAGSIKSGSMQYASFTPGWNSVDGLLYPEIPADKILIESYLDDVQQIRPKSVKISDDAQKLYFTKPEVSLDEKWLEDWTPFPELVNDLRNSFKYIYIAAGDDIKINQVSYTGSSNFHLPGHLLGGLFSEVTNLLKSHSVVGVNIYNNFSTPIFSDSYYMLSRGLDFAYNEKVFFPDSKLNPSFNFYITETSTYFPVLNRVMKTENVGGNEVVTADKTIGDSSNFVLDINIDNDRMIYQNNTSAELQYVRYSDLVLQESKGGVVGFEYLFSMDRSRFIFSNPIDGQSDEIYRISPVINEPVRLLSFNDNRYKAGTGLANTFQKNMYYDNQGILNIGMDFEKWDLTDLDLISMSYKSYKYDRIEYFNNRIEKNNFKSTDNDVATNKEEEQNTYDEAVSISMWSDTDVEMDIKIIRNSATTIQWEAINNFPDGLEQGEIIETSFFTFEIPLTGVFAGISIWCNFFNTELEIGKTFYGTIEKRKFTKNTVASEVIAATQEFPFLEDKELGLKFPFLYVGYASEFDAAMNYYFKDGSKLRTIYEVTVTIPELILFNTKYQLFSRGDIITLQTDQMHIKGYALSNDGILTRYTTSKGDYFIEKMILDFNNHTTKLHLVSV